MRIALVRHGQTPSNVLGLLDTGYPGPGLTELGRAQAAALADGFAGRPVDGVYVSRLVRTHRTAAPLAAARGLRPVELPGLHEVEAGSLELRGDEDAVRRYIDTVLAWVGGDLDTPMPGGADGHEFFGRFDADIARATAQSQHPVIVSHGAAIRAWVAARAVNIAPEFAANRLPNTGVVELVGDPAHGWRLESWVGEPVSPADLDRARRPV